jgi:hypothetical protein
MFKTRYVSHILHAGVKVHYTYTTLSSVILCGHVIRYVSLSNCTTTAYAFPPVAGNTSLKMKVNLSVVYSAFICNKTKTVTITLHITSFPGKSLIVIHVTAYTWKSTTTGVPLFLCMRKIVLNVL